MIAMHELIEKKSEYNIWMNITHERIQHMDELSEFFAQENTDLYLISHHSTSRFCNSPRLCFCPISFDLDLRFLFMLYFLFHNC